MKINADYWTNSDSWIAGGIGMTNKQDYRPHGIHNILSRKQPSSIGVRASRLVVDCHKVTPSITHRYIGAEQIVGVGPTAQVVEEAIHTTPMVLPYATIVVKMDIIVEIVISRDSLVSPPRISNPHKSCQQTRPT